ncbi:hypothetical protein BpHYR1_044305 [Brachionus plicatilis]|uniref:Uncharacterized protein n=1 Tax=Brachionus plicatilis TaxID=10195 RepID=A0A3M7SAX8_BRAPC|nr:hypothetical protein BpHYR1_044305 [Brachionus plicatilis]
MDFEVTNMQPGLKGPQNYLVEQTLNIKDSRNVTLTPTRQTKYLDFFFHDKSAPALRILKIYLKVEFFMCLLETKAKFF